MEELLPFLFFAIVWIFGALGSKQKREEARHRAESQRAAREAAARARMEQRRLEREAHDAEGRIRASVDERGPEPARQEDGSALDMVPDELWAILTGGAPRPTTPSRQPQTPVPAPADDWDHAGPEEGGWVTSPPWNEEDAVHSIEGVSAERTGEDAFDYDDEADRIARARYEDLRRTSWDERPTSRDAIAVRADETSDQRHVEFHDRLRDSEIGAVAAPRTVSRPERLGLRDVADVRRAIVLAEVLGPPKALQE